MAKIIPCYRKNRLVRSGWKALTTLPQRHNCLMCLCLCGWRRGDQNVNYALSVKKIAGSLSDAICNVSFPNGFLRHYRTEYRKDTASAQQRILFSAQIFLARQKTKKDTAGGNCQVSWRNRGKQVWLYKNLLEKGGDKYAYKKSCVIKMLLND